MQVEEYMAEFRAGKNGALDAPCSANEQGIHLGTEPDECPRDGDRWIEVSAGSAAGEDHQHLCRDRDGGRDAGAGHTLLSTADVYEDARHHEREQQVRPPIGHERQRQAGRR